MIERTLASKLREAAGWYPIVTVTGPRQSGKTTLCRAVFPEKRYVNLEPLDVRQYATEDPRGFLAEHAGGAIFDEVQHVPGLPSYLQAEVDERPEAGRFVLTGSQHFGLAQGIAQSLAGRTAVLHLLPPSYDELRHFDTAPTDLTSVLWTGAYPRIFDRAIPPERWLADYVTTYVQRDVRQVLQVGDLQTFTTFLRLCAGRTAQELNLSALGADAGVSHVTARSWLSVLETSFLCFRVPPWHRNATSRLVKAPKLHFFDTGLVCHLLGITDPEHLRHHPLRGAIFETWVASEVYKARVHRGVEAGLFHVRRTRGLEVDLVVERGGRPALIEVKSGATVSGDFLRPLKFLADELGDADSFLVYGGDTEQRRSDARVVPWAAVADQPWASG
jgi:predicted AAA+ superfamily ATPase